MGEKPQWVIREDAGASVLVALGLKQLIGVRAPRDLPALRNLPLPAPDAIDAEPAVEAQWVAYWEMTVEPQTHPASGPLELVEGFDTLVALPATGAEELRERITPHAEVIVPFARDAHERYSDSARSRTGASSYRAYAGAIAEFERSAGRGAHSFTLNVQVLPLVQRGIWWIGPLTIAVSDALRKDVVGFDHAIRPIIAGLA